MTQKPMAVEAIVLLQDTLSHGWKHITYNLVASKSASAPAWNLTAVEAEIVMKSTKHTVPIACLLLRFIRNWSSLQLTNNGVGRIQGLYRVCLPISSLGSLDRYYWPGTRISVLGSCPMSCLFKDLELKNKLQDYILFSFFLVNGTSFHCALLSVAGEMTWEKQNYPFYIIQWVPFPCSLFFLSISVFWNMVLLVWNSQCSQDWPRTHNFPLCRSPEYVAQLSIEPFLILCSFLLVSLALLRVLLSAHSCPNSNFYGTWSQWVQFCNLSFWNTQFVISEMLSETYLEPTSWAHVRTLICIKP